MEKMLWEKKFVRNFFWIRNGEKIGIYNCQIFFNQEKKYHKQNTKALIPGTAEMTIPRCLGENAITHSA